MAMKYLPQPMSEKESSDAQILVRKSHERIKSYFKNDFVYEQLPVRKYPIAASPTNFKT